MNVSFPKITPKGSVLVFSLIILSVMLVTSLTILSSSVLDQKASLSTANSTRSFQIADSGAEQILQQIYKSSADKIEDISVSGASCSGGIVENTSAGWKIRFYDTDGNRIEDCGVSVGDIASIKSEGSANGTVRAVEVAVAQTGGSGGGGLSCFSGSTSITCCRDTGGDEVQCARKNTSSYSSNKEWDDLEGGTEWPDFD